MCLPLQRFQFALRCFSHLPVTKFQDAPEVAVTKSRVHWLILFVSVSPSHVIHLPAYYCPNESERPKAPAGLACGDPLLIATSPCRLVDDHAEQKSLQLQPQKHPVGPDCRTATYAFIVCMQDAVPGSFKNPRHFALSPTKACCMAVLRPLTALLQPHASSKQPMLGMRMNPYSGSPQDRGTPPEFEARLLLFHNLQLPRKRFWLRARVENVHG